MIRASAEIGAGLTPARPARPIAPGERIHVVGAAGAGASAAALHAGAAGAVASGCDPGGPSPYTAALEEAAIPLQWAHDPGHVRQGGTALVDRMAVTKALTSVHADHPELAAARDVGVPLEPWHQTVADAAATYGQRLVAITGTHGKSTSAGWLVHVMAAAERDPSCFVGALLPASLTGGISSTARVGGGDTFIVEADEYAGNFDAFQPSVAVLLNAEWDHPDVFADGRAVVAAFAAWLEAAAEATGELTLVANVSDEGACAVVNRVVGVTGLRVVGVGRAEGIAEIQGRLDDAGRLSIEGIDSWPGPVPLGLPGLHNAANAVAVAGAASVLGVPGQQIADGLASFAGVGRRMELKGEVGGVTVLDDYGHHPTAIRATIQAVRARYPDRRLWGVYEPLTFHRTAALLGGFADALALADEQVVADIWAGRDPDTSIASASALAAAVSARTGRPAAAPGSIEETAEYLCRRVRPGDVVLVMGGGRSYVIAEQLVSMLAEGSGASR